MKKTSKWFAAIVGLAALMGLSALPAHAAGDIYEIRPFLKNTNPMPLHEYVPSVEEFTRENKPYTTADKPLEAGKPLFFNMRLVANTEDVPAGEKAGEFRLDYVGTGTPEVDLVTRPPKIGIFVGDTLKYATLVQAPTIMPYNYYDDTYGDTLYLYDMVFKYTVEPGDLGLPIRLALRDGTPAKSEYDGGKTKLTTEYMMQNVGMYVGSDPWRINYYPEGSKTGTQVTFTYNSNRQVADYKKKDGTHETENPAQASCLFSNFSLSQCGFYTQTVDFDRDEARNPGWKTVRSGRTNQTSVEIIDGEMFATNAIPETTLYVWAVSPEWLASGEKPVVTKWDPDPAVEVVGRDATITIGKDATGTAIQRPVKMATVTIKEHTLYANFSIKGLKKDKASTLIMSSSKDFHYNSAVGYTLDKDFITCEVTCVEGEPELMLKFTEKTDTYTVTSEYTNTLTTMRLSLTDAYDEEINVTITPNLNPEKPWAGHKWSDVVHISDSTDPRTGWRPAVPLVVTIPKGSTAAFPVYLYGMGASADQNLWTSGLGQEVTFTLEPDKGETFIKKITADTLYARPADPVVVNRAELEGMTISGGDDIPATMRDNYTDMTDTQTGYAIRAYWWQNGEEPPTKTTDKRVKADGIDIASADGTIKRFKPDADGTLTALDATGQLVAGELPTVPAEAKGDFLRLWITAPNTAQAAFFDLTISKKPNAIASAYAAKSGDEKPDSFPEITEGKETKAYVGIALESPNKSQKDLYAYLRLKDPTLKDCVSGKCILVDEAATTGIRIRPNESKEYARGELKLLDGLEDGTLLEFEVVLCTAQPYDAKKIYSKFDTTTPLTVIVDNEDPAANDVWMSGWNLDDTGTKLSGEATVGVDQYFTFDIRDAARDLEATGDEAFQLAYQFSGCSPLYSKKVTYKGNPADLIVTNQFGTVGTAKLTVWLFDKDGGESGALSYTFDVVDKPYITIANKDEITTFFEDETPEYQVKLSSNPAKVDLDVELTVETQAKGDLKVGGDFQLKPGTENVYTCTYAKGDTEHSFYVSSADGTAGGASKFAFTAKVTTGSFVPETETPWSEYFSSGRLAPITVKNAKPTLTVDGRLCRAARDESGESDDIIYLNSSNAPIQVAIGEAPEVVWSANDVTKDLEGKITVTIVDQYGSQKFPVTDTTDQHYTPSFRYAGPTTVSFTAQDKDGDSIVAVRFYTVKATRQLNLTAVGPSDNGNGSPHASYYRGAGRGQGHVYAAATCTGAVGFSLDFNCGLAANVKATAQGYRVGDVDDGSLTKRGSMGDIPLTPEGSLATGEPYFPYEGDRDSFFYVWVKDVFENGSFTSTIYGDVSPEVKQAGSATFTLPTEVDQETGGYAISQYEAIFSKEFLKTDNIGDINADAIPDIYALGYKGFGVSGQDQTDMTDLGQYNGDGDYFPFIFADNQGGSVFMPSNTWPSVTKKFTARLEIRGWGDHLNNAYQVLNAQGYAGSIPEYLATNVYTNPAVDPNSTLTAVEYDAWVQAGRDPNWSPERPTDPTKVDTDGDGMPDGYEYYIWYKAHVGWIDNGEHHYLTGRKYNPSNPYAPTEITSATIAAAFDPLTRSGNDWDTRDTDDDGLTDYAEYVLGTDPFDYDTDKDGLPDGYEVVFTETDPTKADSNKNGITDGAENPDNDSIAEISKDMFLVGVVGGSGTEYYCCDGATLDDYTVEVATNILKGTTFEIVTGGGATTNTLVTTRSMAGHIYTNDAGQVCLGTGFSKKNTWQCTQQGGKWVRVAEPVDAQVKLGTVIQNIVEDAEYHDQRLIPPEGGTNGTWYVAFPYQDGQARGKRASFDTVSTKAVLSRSTTGIKLMHYQVYQAKGFHSSTGWIHPTAGGVDTRSFTSMDEFLSMVFFHKTGSLTEAQMAVTPEHSRIWIWQHYSTHPTNADTDGDMMPDGWEFYVMSNTGDKGPTWHYSPLYNFALIPDGQTRDNDSDLLQWPEEYSGTSSSSRYGWSPLKPTWRNKAEPTDPWEGDTDEDGIKDGHEGGYGDSGLGAIVAANFMYNSTGTSGGGLNPLTWDTDGDGLPDPWELEFHGTYTPGSSTTVVTQETTVGDDGTTNNVTRAVTTTVGCTWNMDGMNGTVADAHVDYDHDGLVNWQEYMVGTMRCWRYDDPESGWGVHHASEEELMAILERGPGSEEWNTYWGERLVNKDGEKYNPHFANGYFDAGAPYFSCCRKEFDPCKGDYFYLYDGIYHEQTTELTWAVKAAKEFGEDMPYLQGAPKRYICCDPCNPDTDFDGMDDYYELFHGMNPLLGEPGVGWNNREPYDVVYDAYNRPFYGSHSESATGISALNNWWRNTVKPHATGMATGIKHADVGGYDFVAYPWLNGIAGADPDGDNIVNQEEAIMPKVQAASTYHHTDPTPLWMTDSSYTNSLTRRYYRVSAPQGENNITSWDYRLRQTPTFEWDNKTYNLADFPSFSYNANTGVLSFSYQLDASFNSYGWFFSFEENEGYDSDHDYLSDYEEGQGKTKSASDPQNHDDPLRRQAMYFNGVDAFLETPVATTEWDPDPSDSATEARQNFLYYTVECWAKPDEESTRSNGSLRTLVERAIWADNASAADETLMRKNFLIGIKGGRWYTCFDSSGTDIQPVEVTDGPVATTNWTHLAATYDGTALRLYVNGVCKNIKTTSIQPEHGVAALAIDKAGEMNPRGGTLGHATDEHDESFIAILVGASAKTKNGIVFDSAWRYRNYLYADEENPQGLYTNATTFADYHNFYKGYIDEVRIWDGARSDAELRADYENRTRYTAELAELNREDVYAKWCEGGLRSPASSVQLPPQLMYHWSFDQIAGAISPEDVIKVPAGFDTAKNVLNAKARWSRPADYEAFDWASSAVRSTVYSDNAWVPWINNTVAHLPRFDLTTLDSIYWSDDYAGNVSAGSYGYGDFKFPRTAEVYSRWTQRTYGGSIEYYCIYLDPDFALLNGVDPARGVALAYTCALTDWRSRWDVVSGYGSYHISPKTKDADALITAKALALRFAFRDRNTCGDDILPMGGAYPRRISATEGGMWDTKPNEAPVAADAWAETGNDADNNGLPDWWEEYARANYCQGLSPEDPLNWDTTVNYYGLKIPAYQAYLRDLAKGMVKIGSVVKYDTAYADTRDMDGDNIPDWWEDMYGIDTGVAADAKADPDNDGLSNYQEYLISEVQGWCAVNPKLAHSAIDQDVTDYFLRLPDGRYLGEAVEIRADHDFMEDNREDEIGTDRTKYDPYSDNDEDGWGAWSELRYSTYKQPTAARLVSHLVGEEEVRDFPIPVIHATLRYNGEKTLSGSNTAIRIEAYAGDDLTKQPSATYHAQPGAAETRYYNLGFYTDRTLHGTLTPGHLAAGLNNVSLQEAFVQSDDLFTWTVVDVGVDYTNATIHTGSYADMRKAIQMASGNSYVYVSEEQFAWQDVIYTPTGNNAMSLTVDDQTQTGHFMLATGERFGEVDLTTGDFSFDFAPIKNLYMGTSLVSLQQYYYRIAYKTVLPTMQSRKFQVSLATPDTGSLTEGSTTFVAYMDVDGNGAFTPGTDPIGFAKGVNVGWDNVPELTIEMTDASLAAGKRFAFDPSIDTLRIVRKSMNGADTINGKDVKRRVVYSRDAAAIDRKNVWEGDLISGERYGLDWRNLQTDIREMGVDLADVRSVEYVVVTNTGSVHNIDANAIINRFTVEYSPEAPLPSCVSPASGNAPIVESVRPTFRWTASSDATAFQLQIGDATGNNWFYKTGVTKLPPRDVNGNYVFTAPVFVNDITSGDTWSLANNSNYQWRVMMYNAKFSGETGNKWSDAAAFTTQVATSNDFSTAYGCAKVSVAYYGPATNDLADVIVQLYRTADFTGTPAAQTRLADVTGKVEELTNAVTVSFAGLEPGAYYAVAFIDRPDSPDTLGARDKFETWGYAAQVDFGTDAIWTPTAAIVDASNAKIPSVALIMEDTDLNQNDVLDWEDDVSDLKAATKQTADDTSDTDKDGLTGKEEIGETYTDPYKPDTDGDGMRDGWEERFAGTDALMADADTVVTGDVMAYAETNATLIAVAEKGVTNKYLLANAKVRAIHAGDDIPLNWLMTTYIYPTISGEGESMVSRTLYGVGTNLTGTATVRVVAELEPVTAVLVHDQVYRAYGFNPKTCVVDTDAVNTKAFTALDKYLLIRYLDSQGRVGYDSSKYASGEDYVNKEKLWSKYSLKPLNKDNDADGIQDGWELYVGADPWSFADRESDVDDDGVTLLWEYNDGQTLDPSNANTLYADVGDWDVMFFELYTAESQLADYDNDGLSNWAEYLATLAGYGVFNVYDDCSTGNVLDYFVKTADGKYVGEAFDASGKNLIADHDFINDTWEDAVDVNVANRYVYDPRKDYDGDGWSNYAESRTGTDPSRMQILGVENSLTAEYPQPMIVTKIGQDGTVNDAARLIVQAYSTGASDPDATWTMNSSNATASAGNERILGNWEDTTRRYILSPSSIQPGTVSIYAKDTGFKYYDSDDDSWDNYLETEQQIWAAYLGVTYDTSSKWKNGEASEAEWVSVIHDVARNEGVIGDLLFSNGKTAITVGWINYESGLMEVDWTLVDGTIEHTKRVDASTSTSAGAEDGSYTSTVTIIDYYYRHMLLSTASSYFKVGYTSRYVAQGENQKFYLSAASSGLVREGLNNFVAFSDVDGNGVYTVGEPMGVVRNVNVGWDTVPELVIGISTQTTADRFSVTAKAGQRVCVVRTAINGVEQEWPRALYAKTFVTDTNKLFTEIDLVRKDAYDFDWKYLKDDAKSLGVDNIVNATYEVLLYGTNGVTTVHTLTKKFQGSYVAPTPCDVWTNGDYVVHSAQPSFAWKNASDFPAFALQIATDAKFDDVVYATTNFMPGAIGGTCTFRPDAYVGETLADDTVYYWRVAGLSAKYKDVDWSKSYVASFRTEVDSTNANTGYGKLAAEIRYYGPSASVLSNVIVGVYASADFACDPVACKHLVGTDPIVSLTNEASRAFTDVVANVSFDGIAPGDYYVMAFVDANGNGVRDAYETWGYVCKVATESRDLWAPVALSVVSTKRDPESAFLVMEDTDVNQNMTPDCLEDMSGWAPEPSGLGLDYDRDGLNEEGEDDACTDPYTWDSDEDGMPDGFEAVFAETDPNTPDADTVMLNDVMAYAEIGATLITVKQNGETAHYLLAEDEMMRTIRTGDDIPLNWLMTTYTYPVIEGEGMNAVSRMLYGVGTNLTGTAKVRVAMEPEQVTAVLVHDQVYDEYGFNPNTCVADADAVDTKPFTALDKYLLIRYLDAQGLIAYDTTQYASGEDYVNVNRLWAQYSLKPVNTDNDADGIQDGWELYTGLDPWDYDDARQISAGGEGLTNLQEYDGGHYPTDPAKADTDGDNVSDKFAYQYHLKGGESGLDNDGDGLSNYAEYLISEVFHFAQLDPDNPKTDGSCVDYFRKVGELYFGEVFTDHDQVNDAWEQDYNAFANRDVYDPLRDDDKDGWSNWAEAKAGTHPGTMVTPGVDGEWRDEVPVPTIAATVVYRGAKPLSGNLVFQAWNEGKDPAMEGSPDAAWVASAAAGATNVTKYVGLNPGQSVTYHLGTGAVSPGSLRVWFRDTAAENVTTYSNGYVAVSTATNPQWYYFVADSQRDNDMGDLLLCVTNVAAVKVGSVDYASGLVTIDFGSDALQQKVIDQWINGMDASGAAKSTGIASTAVQIDLARSFVKLEWRPSNFAFASGTATYYLSDCSADPANWGRILEGSNKFTVFCDSIEENNQWDPGEPFGFVQGVGIGWQGGAFTVELTDVSPVFARINLLAAVGEYATDREYYQPSASAVFDLVANESQEPQKTYRKKLKDIGAQPLDETLTVENNKLTRVRVVRAFVDGDYNLGKTQDGKDDIPVGKAVVMDKYLDLNARSYLHEGDFLVGGAHDVGWYGLRDNVFEREVYGPSGKPKFIEGTNVTYMIVLGEGNIAGSKGSNTVFRCLINKNYDLVGTRLVDFTNAIKPRIDATTPGIVYGARPTFRWRMQDAMGTDYDSYTAFEVEIRSKDGAKIYTSGVRDLPPTWKDADGVWYSWTLDRSIESIVGTSGVYTWRVAMYNAKYRSNTYRGYAITQWSEDGSLVVDLNRQQPMNDHGYSTIAASVKYAGPVAVLAAEPKVYLQAYETADFSGLPVAEAFVTDFAELADTSHVVSNACVHGVFQTGTYYLKAFIDSNDNGVQDDFESWGGSAEPVTITDLTVTVPTVGIYIEDADTDGDWIPDAYEYAQCEDLTTINGKVIGGDKIRFIGTIAAAVDKAGVSTGLSGASLTIFQNGTFAKLVSPKLTATVSIDDIRAAVERKINPKTVKITALSLAPDGKTVTLSVAAEVTDSIAGELLGKIYDITDFVQETAKVTVKVYRKQTLAEAGWTLVDTVENVPVGKGEAQIDVPVTGIDMTSGFYRIEIEQK